MSDRGEVRDAAAWQCAVATACRPRRVGTEPQRPGELPPRSEKSVDRPSAHGQDHDAQEKWISWEQSSGRIYGSGGGGHALSSPRALLPLTASSILALTELAESAPTAVHKARPGQKRREIRIQAKHAAHRCGQRILCRVVAFSLEVDTTRNMFPSGLWIRANILLHKTIDPTPRPQPVGALDGSKKGIRAGADQCFQRVPCPLKMTPAPRLSWRSPSTAARGLSLHTTTRQPNSTVQHIHCNTARHSGSSTQHIRELLYAPAQYLSNMPKVQSRRPTILITIALIKQQPPGHIRPRSK